MCFYTRTDYACGDWKWGNMKERCPRQHRIGESCGAKLSHIDSNIESTEICKTCTEIMTKQRRLNKAHIDLARYTTERDLPALAAAKKREIRDIEQALRKLNEQRPSKKHMRSHDTGGKNLGHTESRFVPSVSSKFYPLMQSQDAKYAQPVYNYSHDVARFPLRI
jgi:hypothetical protein